MMGQKEKQKGKRIALPISPTSNSLTGKGE
jgi:hypothetical protein